MKPVSVTVRHATRATPAQAFDAVIPVDLPSCFTGYGPLPAVTGVRDQVGDWATAGDTRTVELSDGGTMSEALVKVEPPGRCSYRVVPETGPLKRIVAHIDGEFRFEPAPDGGTEIVWTYAFVAKRGRRSMVARITFLWRRYARRVVARLAAVADASA